MKGRLRDLTRVETIYRRDIRTVPIWVGRRKLRTVQVRRKRAFDERVGALIQVTTPAEACDVLQAIFDRLDDDQERFVMLVLNAAGDVEGFKMISSGAQDGVGVECKHVFHCALLLGARAIIVAHNHPTRRLVPSAADIELTARLVNAGALLDIPVLDHVIFGRDREHLSLRLRHPALFVTPESDLDA